MNAPDMTHFQKAADTDSEPEQDRFIILFNGSIVHRHGLDIMVRALPLIVKKIPHAYFQIVGGHGGEYQTECLALGKEWVLQNILS